MTVDELRQRLNQVCDGIGITPPFIGPPGAKPLPDRSSTSKDLPEKWCVCTNYMKLNEVTQVLQLPQGDIRTKQQALSGHQWISIFDFAAGFYVVEIAEESRPYTALYVEGRGYFVYCCMPFGLTGAPSCFNEVTAQALHGLVGTIMQLLWMMVLWQATSLQINWPTCRHSSPIVGNKALQFHHRRPSFSCQKSYLQENVWVLRESKATYQKGDTHNNPKS
jgi:hypothetical protein